MTNLLESLMLLPQTAEYALRAVLHIAAHDRPVRVAEIASELDVPQNYLSKTLHQLARAGVLTSSRGPAGGFRLGMAADQLTLQRVVSLFATAGGRRCLLGSGVCGEVPACAVHARWSPVATQMRGFFEATTVADLLPAVSPSRGTLV
jgi:Rrf2 family iron-sulfur cluster assembly transcriptional regulator